jgi:hypothetical protein
MDMAISFIDTRSRRTDPATSKDAAKNAASGKAALQRIAIRKALEQFKPGLTTKELATVTGISYEDIKRRVSEVGGIAPTVDRRDGNAVWAVYRDLPASF